MSEKSILKQVDNALYERSIKYIHNPKYFQKNYKRLLFAINVIDNYLNGGPYCIYKKEDVIYELYKAYTISSRMKGLLSEFSVNIVVRAYYDLRLGQYRNTNNKIVSFKQMIGILGGAKKALVPSDYVTKYEGTKSFSQ